MGIKGFYGRWVRAQKDVVIRYLPPYHKIGWIYFDLNGIFHAAAQEIYGYGNYDSDIRRNEISKFTPEELEIQHIENIIARLNEIISEHQSQQLQGIILCVDGVALIAKIAQQRSRRFRSTPLPQFDSNCITPGTEFMFKLDKQIRQWITTLKSIPNLFYSGHDQPGEGEHKIADLLRGTPGSAPQELLTAITNSNLAHVIYGSDADLFMIALLSPVRGPIYLMREKTATDPPNVKLISSIPKLKETLINRFIALAYKPELKIFWQRNPKLIIQSFVIASFFIGNDFLPHGPMFHDTHKMIEFLIQIVASVGPLINEQKVNVQNLYLVAEQLALKEPEELKERASHKLGPEEQRDELLAIAFTRGQDNIEAFYTMWDTKLTGIAPQNQYFEKVKEECVRTFLAGMQWTLDYYMRGSFGTDEGFAYNSLYAPTMRSLADVLKNEKDVLYIPEKGNRYSFSMLRQLLCVMPPTSVKLLPPELRYLTKIDSPIGFMYPKSIALDGDGAYKPYMALALVPPADIPLVEKVLDEISNSPTLEKYKTKQLPVFIKNNSMPIQRPIGNFNITKNVQAAPAILRWPKRT